MGKIRYKHWRMRCKQTNRIEYLDWDEVCPRFINALRPKHAGNDSIRIAFAGTDNVWYSVNGDLPCFQDSTPALFPNHEVTYSFPTAYVKEKSG